MSSHRIEIIKELRALEQFCAFKVVRSGEENERFLKDYLADIEDFPLDAIRQACSEWRKSGATKYPTPGQLIPLIRSKIPEPKAARIEPWRPLSDDEYQALSLREKIRHHTILAHECSTKAGPMFRSSGPNSGKGQHLTPEDMPPEWHELRRRAQGHADEAKRLRSYLRMQDRSA